MINWQGKKNFDVDGVKFRITNWSNGSIAPATDDFPVFKKRWIIERYAQLIERLKPRNIFELGIYRGGSCVFFHRLAKAEKLVAIELDTERIQAVDAYIQDNRLGASLIPLYGVDQADKSRLTEILDSEFADQDIDLVIDDASHFLDETRSSFNTIFPRLRPGGAYVIEDWPWAHAKVDRADDNPFFFPEREPLTKLIFELVLACPSTYDVIEKIEIDKNSATIWRGSGQVDRQKFNVASCSLARGRNLIAPAG